MRQHDDKRDGLFVRNAFSAIIFLLLNCCLLTMRCERAQGSEACLACLFFGIINLRTGEIVMTLNLEAVNELGHNVPNGPNWNNHLATYRSFLCSLVYIKRSSSRTEIPIESKFNAWLSNERRRDSTSFLLVNKFFFVIEYIQIVWA